MKDGEEAKSLRARISGCSAGFLLVVPVVASALTLGFLSALFVEWNRFGSTRGYKAWEAVIISFLVGGAVLVALFRMRRRASIAPGHDRVSLVRRVWALLFDLTPPVIALVAALALELSRKVTFGLTALPVYAGLVLLFLCRDAWGGALSPGRRLLGYRIAGPKGKACTLPRSILRNLIPFGAPLLWMFYKLWTWGPYWCGSVEYLFEILWEMNLPFVACLALVLAVGLYDLGLVITRPDGRRNGDLIADTRAVPRDALSA